jgi:hypothetical protein
MLQSTDHRRQLGVFLRPPEGAYLFELTRRRDPEPPAAELLSKAAAPELIQTPRSVTAPACLLDRLARAGLERTRGTAALSMVRQRREMSVALRVS